jgi:hypothetical protein
MAEQDTKFFLQKIPLILLLSLMQCGVKLPTRVEKLQSGPHDSFAIGKTGTPLSEDSKAEPIDEEKKKAAEGQ